MDCVQRYLLWVVLYLTVLSSQAYSLDPNTQPPGYIAAVALSSTALATGVTLYRPLFTPDDWSGDLLSWSINPNNGQLGMQHWSAGEILSARDWRTRIIVTRRDDDHRVIAFRSLNDLSTTQKAALVDQDHLDYLRGDAGQEGTRFRARSHVNNHGVLVRNILGAIIHTNPLYRDGRLYVGANDGMLHVFDAGNGEELYAYIPSMIYPRLSLLASNYNEPRYSVDGGLASTEVEFHDKTQHILLAGSLGAGGQGLFVLDISSPSAITEQSAMNSLLWEFSDSSNSELGYTYGTPQFARLDDGRWAVVIGNGYASTVADGRPGSGTAQLLIIDAESGTLIRRIDTYSGNTSNPNGLSTPRIIDSDGNGRMDYAFAGDLAGNIWRFDLHGTDSNAWDIGCGGNPLYTAHDPSGNSQAITSAPSIIAHPIEGIRVLFGTGGILSNTDLDPDAGLQVNSIYGVHDRLDVHCQIQNTALHQTLTNVIYPDDQKVRISSSIIAEKDHDVWRVDLPAGERIVTDPQLESGRLLVTTTQPFISGGEVWLMELDAQNGGAPAQVAFDMNGDGALDSDDNFDGNDDGDYGDPEDRICGLYYGSGLGSAPVSVNLSASQRLTYINRIDMPTISSTPCADDCGSALLNDVGADEIDADNDTLITDNGTADDPSPIITDSTSFCGINSCIVELRTNLGRVAWKELLAE